MKPRAMPILQKRLIRWAVGLTSTLPLWGLVNSCNDYLVNATKYVDPCGTILANCVPGSFQANTAPIGSAQAQCLDPTCTIPGACNPGVPVIGSVRPICN
ncbi:MAG: hypothetical protein HY287_02100 [Planctomycetes bacterium]|nr:hypothetical protein [Planctomycetota bacterium]MBI3833103.1 hypothetical protein [Planctomycetota bacterium]